MPIALNSYVRSTGASDSAGRTIMEGRTPAQVASDLAAELQATYLRRSQDLADLADPATARANLGLGTAALLAASAVQAAAPALDTLSGAVPDATGLSLLDTASPIEARRVAATVGLLCSQVADVGVVNSTAESDLLGTDDGDPMTRTAVGDRTLAADALLQGSLLRLLLRGRLSSVGTDTLRLRVYLGTDLVADTTATAMPGALTDRGWSLAIDLACRETGATGEVQADGAWRFAGQEVEIVGAPVVIDTTVPQEVQVTATWGAADAANEILCTVASIELADAIAIP